MPAAVNEDAALDALLYPFVVGDLPWPQQGASLFLRARGNSALRAHAPAGLRCQQSFKPYADVLQSTGFRVDDAVEDAGYALVMVLPPRQRDESRALLAQALQRVAPHGLVVVAALNTEGARSVEADLARLAGPVATASKHKCRVVWVHAEAATMDTALIQHWAALDAPRQVAEGRFWSRPGLFAWDRIDAASALLAAHLPTSLAGRGADLGAGYGYLSTELLTRCPGIRSLHLFEAEARALAMARRNLEAATVATEFHWHDVTRGLPGRYDFIVSNPPFHQGRADQPQIGQAFIAAAAQALVAGGCFWLVANRHLPYEASLSQHFHRVRTVIDAQGFKVIEAVKGRA